MTVYSNIVLFITCITFQPSLEPIWGVGSAKLRAITNVFSGRIACQLLGRQRKTHQHGETAPVSACHGSWACILWVHIVCAGTPRTASACMVHRYCWASPWNAVLPMITNRATRNPFLHSMPWQLRGISLPTARLSAVLLVGRLGSNDQTTRKTSAALMDITPFIPKSLFCFCHSSITTNPFSVCLSSCYYS